MSDEASFVLSSRGKRHLEGVGDQALPHVVGQLPADDAPGVDVEHHGQVAPALPGADIGEVGKPQLIGARGAEVAAHEIGSGYRRRAGDRRTLDLAWGDAGDAVEAHQPLDSAARHTDALVAQVVPDLELAVDAVAAGMHTAYLGKQPDVTQRTGRRWPCAPGTVGAGRDLELPTDRLDPEALTSDGAGRARGRKTRSPP